MNQDTMEKSRGEQLLHSFSDVVARLAERVSPSVVNVDAGMGNGSGVVWTEDGLVVTASHVVGKSPSLLVTLHGGMERQARLVGRDPYLDMAVLKTDSAGLAPLARGSARRVRTGEFVLALASGNGKGISVTPGVVTSARQRARGFWGVEIEGAVVTDTRLNPGYLGGPLVDSSGRLLGLNVAYFSGRGIAVPVDSLEEEVARLSKNGKRGYLGVVVEPIELPRDLSKMQGVGQDGALFVRSVEPGSPARASGVALGDVILGVGGKKTTDGHSLYRALGEDVVGKSVRLRILRAEKVIEMQATPREAEA
ncbi:MAG: trypsin-like peptidase domain-containing protein [Nitrososphaerota archaeon]|nr:trypsin-like peptidase domain-containing protein [Nitrososphaerota archaeon]MDG6942919.1 trypsin-like peptidase domain-containing protein [Nitrososphaerota archaeon]